MMEPLRGDRLRVGDLLDSVDDAAASDCRTRRTLMAEREQVPPLERSGSQPEVEEEQDSRRIEADDQKLDELLDEIDQVLEENAEEFVKNYIQKGGE